MALGRRLSRIIEKWQTLIGPVWDPYRPELHYMRGPGPKWHAKQRRVGRLNAV
jgi:hypothetical protein